MKRHFMKSLKAFGMGVMSLVAASSLAVSCYDDSALREEISGVVDDLKGLTARLDSLENSISSQISAVQALYAAVESLEAADDALASKDEELAAKIIIAEVKATDNGKIQVVLTNGTSVEIEPASNVKNQLVTVVDNNWALVDPTTGNVTTLKINDAAIPVSHPDFKIRFNEATRFVEYSVDGGVTWAVSDVEIPEEQDIPECNALITDVDTWSEEGYAIFYTIWDEVIKLPVAEEFSFNIKSGRLTFGYGDVKEVAVSVNNVADYAVMTKPEGWKATFVDETLVITAPAAEAIESGLAESEGYVRVHVTTTGGKCKVAKLGVSVLPGLSVAVDAQGNITVVNPFGSVDPDSGDGMFDSYYLGITTDIETFESDPVAFIESLDFRWDVIGSFPYNLSAFEEQMYTYDEENNPVDTLKTSVASYAETLYYPAPERGQSAIVFVLTVDPTTGHLNTESLAFVYYEPREATIVVDTTATTWNDAAVTAHMYGYDKYEYGVHPSEDMLYEQFAMWQMYSQYGVSMGGMQSTENGTYEGALSGFGLEPGAETSPLMPNTTYYAYVLGVNDNMDPNSITWEEFRANNVVAITTKNITAGGAATSAATFTPDYTLVSAELTASDDACMLWHGFFPVSAVDSTMTNDQLVELLLSEGYMVSAEQLPYTFTSQQSGVTLGSNTAVKYLSVAVNANGEYGTVNVQTTATKEFTYSETFSVSAEDAQVYLDGYYAGVYVKFAGEGGNIKTIRYKNVKTTDATYTDEFMAKDMPVNDMWTYTNVEVSTLPDGILKIANVGAGEYRLGFIAYDENGEVAAYQSISYAVSEEVDMSTNISLSTDEDYATSKPTYTFTLATASKYYSKYSCEIDVPEGCMAWVGMGKPAEVTEDYPEAHDLVNALAAGQLQSRHFSGKFSVDFNYVYSTYNFYLAWVDVNGKYHEAEIIPVSSLVTE